MVSASSPDMEPLLSSMNTTSRSGLSTVTMFGFFSDSCGSSFFLLSSMMFLPFRRPRGTAF